MNLFKNITNKIVWELTAAILKSTLDLLCQQHSSDKLENRQGAIYDKNVPSNKKL